MITAGMLSSAVGFTLLSGITPGRNLLNAVLLGALFAALGMGFTLVPATIVAMQGVERFARAASRRACSTPRGWLAGRWGWPCCRRSRPRRPRVVARARPRWR